MCYTTDCDKMKRKCVYSSCFDMHTNFKRIVHLLLSINKMLHTNMFRVIPGGNQFNAKLAEAIDYRA